MIDNRIDDDMKVVIYDGSEGWIKEGDKIIIQDSLGGKVVVEDILFFDPIQGFIQTPSILYVPYRNVGESH